MGIVAARTENKARQIYKFPMAFLRRESQLKFFSVFFNIPHVSQRPSKITPLCGIQLFFGAHQLFCT